MSDPLQTFRAEAEEHLAALEAALLEMEQTPDNPELIDLAFRAMHTVKGAGGMFGFNALSDFTHHLESAFDQVRSGRYAVAPELISVMLDARDHIESLLLQPEPDAAQRADGQQLLGRLHAIIPASESAELQTPAPPPAPAPASSDDQVFRIRFTPHAASYADGFDLLPILRELQGLGNCVVTTRLNALPPLGELDPEACHLSCDVVLVSNRGIDALRDVFIFVNDDWQVSVVPVDLGDDEDGEQSAQLGEILVERGLISAGDVEAILTGRPRTGDLLCQAGLVSEADINAALAEQKLLREARERRPQAVQEAIVRVPAARLDALMNLVGELVIVQARMNQFANSRNDEDMLSISEDLDRLTTELRDNTFSIRMLPIGTTFGRFRRLVRDLSHDLGKEIQLETEGAETELDKMVIDRLGDPMVHLIRNCIDHGIETPEVRAAAGKPRCGSIHLSAEHAESHVVIRIADDGAGLDSERIRSKAVERGLIRADASVAEHDIHQLIFEPGFSTATEVSDVSGRGVGMDVVKKSIHDLGGQVGITSQPGAGTTIKITLPMTLAIIEGLMVAVSDERYVLPLSAVEECVELEVGKDSASDKCLVNIRGELVPYMRLREWFDVPGRKPAIEQIVVTRLGEERFGFSVDEVVGQYQTVIKRLGKLYEGTRGLAGATILGDGGVAMILDASGLMEALEDAGRQPPAQIGVNR